MKKNFFLLFVVFVLTNILNAQVGINTSDPKSTLDINGNLKIRNISSLASLSSDQTILLRDKSTTGDYEIKEISSDILVIGNANAYYASKSGSWSLLDLGLGNSWAKINLTGSADTKLGSPALFTTGVYTAQQAGTYSVYYEFQFASGVNLEALGGKKLGILKNNTVWDEKIFDGVRLVLLTINIASLPITSTKLSSIVQLNVGDTLTFAVNTSGLLPVDLTLLSSAKVNLYIYKISN